MLMTRSIIIAAILGLTISQVQAASATAERLDRLERRVSLITELTLEVEGLKRENRRLQGRMEELQHLLDRMQRKQREQYLDVDERLTRLQSGAPLPASPAPTTGMRPSATDPLAAKPVPQTAEPASTVAPGDPAREEAAYAAAYDLLRPEQRRYAEAIEAFELFIQQYPNAKYTDNARYWLGEANYVTQKNDAAMAAFQQLLQQYPKSPKAPGALLKIGYIQDASGKTDAAKVSLNRLITDYPTSSAAGMAKKRLANMQHKNN